MNAVLPTLARTRSQHECHFRVEAKEVYRSKGRSAVAAAAYRAGARLEDGRQGRVFDYSRKTGIEATMILAPEGAPSWVFDRSALWTRAELAEKHPRAITARELIVSIPREIAPEDRAEWVRQMCAPLVARGAVCDIALHRPDAADGNEQPHAHILITERKLSEDGQGFARTKNADLLTMLVSGGRMGGGKRGDALKRERARWSQGINAYMRQHGLTARADSRSRQDRGAADLEVEPTFGEVAASRYRRTRQPSQNQQIVGAMRHRRRAEQVAIATEVEMEHAVQQASKVPFAQPKQEIKERLLRERYPDVDTSRLAHDDIYRVDVSSKTSTKVLMRDSSVVEVRKDGRVLLYGPDGTAQQLAEALADAQGWERDVIQRLPPSARASAQEGRYRRRQTSKEEIEKLVQFWTEQGYADVTASPKGVWVTLGSNTRLLDSGPRLSLYGSVTPDALAAMATKARLEWGGRLEIVSGSDDFKAKLYLEACRQGVQVVGGYDPPSHVQAQAEAERKQRDREAAAVTAVADAAATAREALRYVREETSDPHVSAELRAYLDSLRDHKSGKFDTRAARTIANMETAQVAPLVAEMERKGAQVIEEQAAAEAAQAPKPRPQRRQDDEPGSDTPEAPAPGRKR